MAKTIKEFSIPRCLERTPEIFGLSVGTVAISLGLILLALIMIAKSIWISILIISLLYGNLKLVKKFKKVGGLFSYLTLLIEKKENIRVNSSIESLIKKNKV